MRPLLLIVLLTACAAVRGEDAAHRLWFAQPAKVWNEALPVGNGRLGAMVFGGLTSERIQFNESTLWTGRPHDYAKPNAVQHLPALRRLITEGKTNEAHQLARREFLGDPARQQAYQPFGDIRLDFPAPLPTTDYTRELDLDRAVAAVSYTVGDTRFRRETFASFPAQALVTRLSASQPGRVTVGVRLDSPHRGTTTRLEGDTFVLSGAMPNDGLRFEARLRVHVTGGAVTADQGALAITGADEVLLVLTAATSFRNFEDISGDPSALTRRGQAALRDATFAALLATHVRDHAALYRRCTLSLGSSAGDACPTDERLQAVKRDGLTADRTLPALYFNYGRYLLIASSRPGGQAANLQGIWNELLDPPWESKWTTNINLEMNYWPAEVTNLAACHTPLFDLIDDLVVSGRRTARAYYGAEGWVLHHNTDLWRGTAPVNNIDGVWTTGGAWLCHHLWEHYQFTGDREFLQRRAYPAMRAAAQFFVGFLMPDAATGRLVALPSYSPEQGGLCAGATLDQQLIRALFRQTAAAATVLDVDADFARELRTLADRLLPDQIGRHGQLQEWKEDVDKPNNAHRHLSPLWALYPGNDLTPENPALFAAAQLLLRWRGEGSTGWSYAWRIPLWARVHDGEFAYRQIEQLFRRKTLSNLLDLCGPFQIDGNFGATGGIAEMLVQSHRRDAATGRTLIELLPALPSAWTDGAIHGLCARDGFEVDLTWHHGRLASVNVLSKLGKPARLQLGPHRVDFTVAPGTRLAFDSELNPLP